MHLALSGNLISVVLDLLAKFQKPPTSFRVQSVESFKVGYLKSHGVMIQVADGIDPVEGLTQLKNGRSIGDRNQVPGSPEWELSTCLERQGLRLNFGVMRIAKKEIVGANILEVEVGTTGFMGGDSGHGGRTYFQLTDLGSTDMRVRLIPGGIRIDLEGDSELATIIEALEFASAELRALAKIGE